MALGIIITIILVGLALIFLEIFFIPGTTLFGALGGVAVVIGVILMYSNYGAKYGNISFGVSLAAVIISIAAGFKVIQSNKLAMKGEITGRVNEVEKHLYNVGDQGETTTELRPNGKAVFNGNKVEVFSGGEYVQKGTVVTITKVTNDKIFVKPLNT